jgi:2-polyprenyl-3-methyl-5-hydroxy-6-metoxy-1,4-benzoquinol methylase
MDVSRKAIEIVRSKGFKGIVRDVDENGLGLSEDEKYDYILFVEALEHLKYPHKVLIEACKHAKEGVIVTLPNTGYHYWRL